jgi:D-alanine-D-alanine ligase
VNSRFRLAFGDYAGPFIVKPVSGRASLHVHVVESRAELAGAVAEVHGKTNDVVLIEKYLSGREFCIAAAGPLVARCGRLFRGAGPFTFGALERVLEAEEKIFTSMDVRPITGERCRPLRATEDAAVAAALHELARSVFLEFNLGSIIRLDVRADEAGNLYILEANPKPDLKQPGEGVTSLVCEGLSEFGMSYDDLILSLLADRLDYLFWHRPEAARHILELSRGAGPARPAGERTPAGSQNGRLELGIRDLQAAIEAVRTAHQRKGFMAALGEVTDRQFYLETSPRPSRRPGAAAQRAEPAHGVES